jgi:hypothetical protein
MLNLIDTFFEEDAIELAAEVREAEAETKFLVYCGARWINHRDQAAASELIAVLDSNNEEFVILAGALLVEGCACA